MLRGVGGEAAFAARYRAESQAGQAAGVRVAQVESLLEAAQILLPGIFVALVTWLGARFALSGEITPGELVAFYGYAAFLVVPLRTLTETANKLTRGARVGPPGGPAAGAGAGADLAGRIPSRRRPTGGELVDPESGVVVRPGRAHRDAAADPATRSRSPTGSAGTPTRRRRGCPACR